MLNITRNKYDAYTQQIGKLNNVADPTRAARAAAEAASSAAQRMEMADANAERTNLVDREWFRAVNGVAGLRAAR